MDSHKNARLTYVRRIEMVQDITRRGLSVPQAAAAHGVSAPTARKWLGRYLVGGEAGLCDASSRPDRSPRASQGTGHRGAAPQAIDPGAHCSSAGRIEEHGQPGARSNYNWHRPHQGIGGAVPMSRLSSSKNNLLTLHS